MPNRAIDRSATGWAEIERRLNREARTHRRLEIIGRLLMIGWAIWFFLVFLY